MLRLTTRRYLKQVINRHFIPAANPILITAKPAYNHDIALDVPVIDFGQMCLEPLKRQEHSGVGRNASIVQQWRPIEKNVIGIINEYAYPACHGLFCRPGHKYNFVQRGLIERLKDGEESSPVKDFYEFMFHENALRNVDMVYPSMPVVFDIIQLENAVRIAAGDDEIENCPFANAPDNPLMDMGRIGQVPESDDETDKVVSVNERVFLMGWNVRPLTQADWADAELREMLNAYDEEFLPELLENIATFEERDIENATEYLKYRLADKKKHFDVDFYATQSDEDNVQLTHEIVRDELITSNWEPVNEPVNWDVTYEPIQLEKYGYY